MLTHELIGGFNPFDFITCPVCKGDKFTSLSHASVWCDKCNTRFNVRHTAGDPGCVVDADTESTFTNVNPEIRGYRYDILKLGDYASGWLDEAAINHLPLADKAAEQERWDRFQVEVLGMRR